MTAEVQKPLVPAAGQDFVTLTGWTGSALFSATPVAGEQIEGPDTLTYPADSDPTGPDGTYTLRHITLSGSTEAVSYQIGTGAQVPQGTITFGTATVDQTTISQPFTYSLADQTGFEYRVSSGGGAFSAWAATTSPVSLTGLTADTIHTIEVRAVNATGAGTAASTTVTTDVEPSSAEVTVPFIAGPTYTTATLEEGFDPYNFQGWPAGEPAVGWQFTTLTADGYFDSQGNYFSDVEHIHDVWVTDLAGTVYYETVDNTGLEVADETAPTVSSASVPTTGDNITVQMSEAIQVGAGGSEGWVISLGDATVSSAAVDGTDATIINLTPSRTLTTEDSLTIGYTQPGDGFQDQAATPNDLATLSGQSVTNNSTQGPADVTGPVVQSVNVPVADTYGIGDALSFTVNWDESATVTGTPALNLSIGGSARQANYVSGSGTGALVFTYTVQEGDEDTNGLAVSTLTLDGGTIQDSDGNDATLTLNGVENTAGVVVDGIRPVVTIVGQSTSSTTPTVSGSAGDAASLTLVVNSVTYNPTPSGGEWSQALNALSIGTYAMTLNGADAAGNAAVEDTAQLEITAPPPASTPGSGRRGFLRPSVRGTVNSIIGSIIS